MGPNNYQQLDETCERSKEQLSQLILDRKDAISRFVKERLYLYALKVHHFWAQQLCAAIVHYAQAANMAIVARVLNLPRELRDTVYMHLWEPERTRDPERDLLYWWEHFDEPWLIQSADLGNLPRSANRTDLRPPHFTDQAFVGQEFAREVLKRFQDTIGKDLRPQADKNPVAEFSLIDASMEAFVKKDALGIGTTMEELVRNLDLRIDFQCDALEYDEDRNEVNETLLTGIGELATEKCLAELDKGVAALLSIPYAERMIVHDGHVWRLQTRPRIITLVIRQESASNIQDCLVPILRLVRRAYKGLKDKGFTVKIQYHSEEIGMKIMFEEDVWAWTDKEWRLNLTEKNASKVEPEQRDLVTLAEVWKHLRTVLFNAEHMLS